MKKWIFAARAIGSFLFFLFLFPAVVTAGVNDFGQTPISVGVQNVLAILSVIAAPSVNPLPGVTYASGGNSGNAAACLIPNNGIVNCGDPNCEGMDCDPADDTKACEAGACVVPSGGGGGDGPTFNFVFQQTAVGTISSNTQLYILQNQTTGDIEAPFFIPAFGDENGVMIVVPTGSAGSKLIFGLRPPGDFLSTLSSSLNAALIDPAQFNFIVMTQCSAPNPCDLPDVKVGSENPFIANVFGHGPFPLENDPQSLIIAGFVERPVAGDPIPHFFSVFFGVREIAGGGGITLQKIPLTETGVDVGPIQDSLGKETSVTSVPLVTDLDGDGLVDLAILTGNLDTGVHNSLILYKGDGTGNFPTTPTVVRNLGTSMALIDMTVTDVEKDGTRELAIVRTFSGTGSSSLEIYNNVFTTFNLMTSLGPPSPGYHFVLVDGVDEKNELFDCNLDGKADLVVTGASVTPNPAGDDIIEAQDVFCYVNQGNGQFSPDINIYPKSLQAVAVGTTLPVDQTPSTLITNSRLITSNCSVAGWTGSLILVFPKSGGGGGGGGEPSQGLAAVLFSGHSDCAAVAQALTGGGGGGTGGGGIPNSAFGGGCALNSILSAAPLGKWLILPMMPLFLLRILHEVHRRYSSVHSFKHFQCPDCTGSSSAQHA